MANVTATADVGRATAADIQTASVFDVGINDPLPLGQALMLGFQNIFGMIGMFVFPGITGQVLHLSVEQTAHLYGMTFLVSGFVTACQALLILKLPIVHGPYVGSFTALLALGQIPDAGLGLAFGSAFVVDTDQVTITRTEEKLGLNSSATNDIAVDSLVDPDRLLGELHHGFRIAMSTLDGGRIGIAAQAVGIAQAAYDVALRYAQERHAFGHPIADFQAIQHKLANMSMEIDAARLLVYRAAWLKDNGREHTEAGAKAKLFASEMARRQTAEAIQVLGGYGYTKEFPVERYYRDAKVTEIYEGTSEIQRLVIARSILHGAERRARTQA